MSYSPHQRNTSGIVFFGEQGNQPTFYSDSNFLIQDGAAGHIKIPNLVIGDGGNIGSTTDPDAIAIASNGNVTMSQSLSITGDLTVNGTTTTVNSTVVTVEDPILILGKDSANTSPYGSDSDDNKDRGIAFAWNIDGAGPSLGFFGHDDSVKGFTYISSGTVAGEVFSGTPGWAVFAGVSGDLAGNATSASSWSTARNITIADQMSGVASVDGSTNVTINVSANSDLITDQTELLTVDNADQILIYDDGVGLRRITRANFVSGLGGGGMTSFSITDNTTPRTVDDGDTVQYLSDGTIDWTTGAGSATIHLISGVVATNSIDETHLMTSVAGDGLVGGNGTAISVGAGSLIDVTANAIEVDLTEAASATIADDDFIIFLDGGTTGDESKGSTRGLASLLGGSGLSVSNSTLAVNAGDGITIDTNQVEVTVDDSTVELSASDGTGAVRVKDSGITEAKRSRVVVVDSTTSTIGSSEDVSLVDATSGAITMTLPSVTTSGKIVRVKKTDSSGNVVTVQRGGTSTIDGATTKILYSQYESITIISDGTNWHII